MENEKNPGYISANAEKFSHIKGWGIDADPENDPTYPMKQRTGEEHLGYAWERPQQQQQDVEILTSTERKNMPAVFGTAVPPSSLSGMIRRYAYTWSESDLRRWVPLLVADRVAVAEGVIEDIASGTLPNIYKEKGLSAELKYNKKEFLIKAAAATAVAVAIGIIIYNKKKAANSTN